jgi:hypothetical protein
MCVCVCVCVCVCGIGSCHQPTAQTTNCPTICTTNHPVYRYVHRCTNYRQFLLPTFSHTRFISPFNSDNQPQIIPFSKLQSESDIFYYNYILVLKEIALKMATWLAETCYWPQYIKTTYTKLNYICWLLIHLIYDMIYLLTAIGLTPGGSSTVHIYTQTVQ